MRRLDRVSNANGRRDVSRCLRLHTLSVNPATGRKTRELQKIASAGAGNITTTISRPTMTAHNDAPQRLNTSVVEHLLQQLCEQDALELDLREIGAIERGAGAILSNALVGTLGDLPLKVNVGDMRSDWITTSGLAFALANRPGATFVRGRATPGDTPQWARPWRPGFIEPLRAMMPRGAGQLFTPDQLGETSTPPDLYGPTYAAFVSPHLTRPTLQRHPLTTLLWPWLDRLIPRQAYAGADQQPRRDWVAGVGRIVDEIVGNICEHAFSEDAGSVHSLVQVSVTRGGGERSANRLHLCIQDSGRGIPATARPKLNPALNAELEETQLISRLLEGTLAPWGRGRGQGLPAVADVARRLKGHLRLATKTTRATIDGESRDNAARASRQRFRIDGTVVTVTLPVPEI
jgi:Histidine kinase-, DNA gyrase B-, and HSP90-like ATPase